MKKILIYGHGGALNHGSEALVLCLTEILREKYENSHIMLVSHFPEQDEISPICVDEIIPYKKDGVTNTDKYKKALSKLDKDVLLIFLAADILCYQNWQRYKVLHEKALEIGAESIMINSSIDTDCVDDEMKDFLKSYSLITARESLTYQLLIDIGCKNVVKTCDLAFGLESKPTDFTCSDFVAINLSPLVCKKNDNVIVSFKNMVKFILEETNLNVVLVPHVLMSMDNDYDVLQELKSFFADEDRVSLVSDKLSCLEYKYIISKARFGVFNRTHASIAAYSTCVPSIVIGYSIKSQGIATDLGMLDYLIDVYTLEDTSKLTELFKQLVSEESNIKIKLKNSTKIYMQNFNEYDYFN